MKIYFRHSDFRKGQKDIIKDISEAIDSRTHLLLHAPTGTGKTDSTLSVALKYAIDHDLKVLFLTPKTSQHKIALEVVNEINHKYDIDIKTIDFVGKRNMCIDPVISKTGAEFYEVCNKVIKQKSCSFYNNIKPQEKIKKEFVLQNIQNYLKGKNVLSHQQIIALAENHKDYSNNPQPLCAYELAKIFAKDCKLIIADYYHVFSGKIANSVLSEMNIDLSDCIIIVDEAHNLQDRLSKLVSKKLSSFVLHRCIEEAKTVSNKKIVNVITKFINNFENVVDKKLENTKKEEIVKKEELLIPEIEKNLFEFISEIEDAGLKYIEKSDLHKSALVSFALFLEDWIVDKKEKIRFVNKERGLFYACHNAVDISEITKPVFEKARCAILMSATLTPLNMYRELYGLDKKTLLKEHSNPFDIDKRLNLLLTNSSTKYTSRSSEEYKQIAQSVSKIINSVSGNSIVFFPSFQILNQVVGHISTMKQTLTQTEAQSTKDFENMIFNFKKLSKNFGGVLYAVMGGKASEGIDLPGDYLKCAIIVGIPLSVMSLEMKFKIDYYQQKYNNGWLYAYIQPAIQKVIQSAGRVIRTDHDRGVVVFIDKRYLWDNYRRCFPKDLKLKISKDISKEVYDFFVKS
jgi:DNA excision repair protein ERCC-2